MNTGRFVALVTLALGAFAADRATADDRCEGYYEDTRLLAAGRYAELEARYGALPAQYRSGRLKDRDYEWSFWQFRQDRQSCLDAAFVEWVGAYPRSYVAAFARGVHEFGMAGDLRDQRRRALPGLDARTEEAQRLAIVKAEMQRSLELDPKPIISYGLLIDVASITRDLPAVHVWLARAVKLEPRTEVVRNRALWALARAGDGDLAPLRGIAQDYRAKGGDPQTATCMDAFVVRQEMRALQDMDEQWRVFDRIIEMCPRAEDLVERGNHHYASKRTKEALEDYDRAVGLDADYAPAWRWRGALKVVLQRGDQAIPDFERAAALGDGDGATRLGWLYFNGQARVPQDHEKARAACERGMELGDLEAYRCLANLRREGKALPRDGAEIRKLLETAAMAGAKSAQSDLGEMYFRGDGVPKDDARAVYWWCWAARSGHEPARYRIGEVMGVDAMLPPLEEDCEALAAFVDAPWYERWYTRIVYFWAIVWKTAQLLWGSIRT